MAAPTFLVSATVFEMVQNKKNPKTHATVGLTYSKGAAPPKEKQKKN